jgi:curved DNA-binding protein CbpA
MNAFETMGIEARLVIADESLRDAFREAGRLAHPDGGGGEGEFARLRQAFDILASPSQRLRHWLELRGITASIRGTVAASLMDLFAEIGGVSQQAEALIRRREQAMSALARALLETETQACREAVERALRQVNAAIERECAAFSDYEEAAQPDAEAVSTNARNLAFLEKWRAGLRGLFARMV